MGQRTNLTALALIFHALIVSCWGHPDSTFVDRLDSAIQKSKPSIQTTFSSIKGNDDYPDIYFEFRIEHLNKTSPIKLDYNQDVKKYIDLYLTQRRDKLSKMLGLRDFYFPVFEEYLDKYNLPLELKYLPVIESALDPLAQSSSGAMGLWQLLFNSSKLLGLTVDSYVDERCDLYKSTDAACRYLKYLYGIFNDWQLALAAYNGGPGEIRNAILKSGGKTNFWDLQPYLPEQTKWYVPAFVAAVYLFNYAHEHGISSTPSGYNYFYTDTVRVKGALDFGRINEVMGIDKTVLQNLNPSYRRFYIPDDDKVHTLTLPSDKILLFLKKENQIYSRLTDTADYIDVLKASGDTAGLQRSYYVVGKGDFLHKIALEQGCTIENIKAWNHLRSNDLNKGQRLVLWKKGTEPQVSKAKSQKFFYYTVKKGDTMWSIAERFKCDSVNAIKIANNIKDERDLKPGQQLKIAVNE